MTKPKHKFEVKPHAINCLIERGDDVTKIDVTLAPKVTFNDGKPAKTDLNITKVDASTVISTVITGAAWAENNFSLFRGEMTQQIKDFAQK